MKRRESNSAQLSIYVPTFVQLHNFVASSGTLSFGGPDFSRRAVAKGQASAQTLNRPVGV